MVAKHEQPTKAVCCHMWSLQRFLEPKNADSHEIPNRPCSKVGSDIFEWRREHYLVLVDYYSNWIEFDLTRNQTAAEIINLMQKRFTRWRIPEDNVRDSGTNYDSVEFSQLCKRNNIKQTKYSPHHHQSNGKSESAVKRHCWRRQRKLH